ncbi:MAG TPA: peptidylprolyl isomerase, partial [Flavobacterium sp.]
GWHIVKLIEKFPLKPLQELQPDLESKIEKDDRSRVIAASMNQQLRKRFPVKKNKKEYSSVVESLNKEYVAGNWNIPDTNNYKKPVLTIKNNPVAVTEFLTYIKNQQNNFKGSTLPLPKIVDNLYEKFVDQELKNYYTANLENEYPEFGAIVEEYRDGLLLFDLMEKEIWQKSKTDSIGLQNFYATNKNKYQWAKRVDAVVMSSINEDIIKKAAQLLKQNKSAEEIKAQLNVDKKGLILEKQGVFEENSGILPKNITLVKGVTDIIQEGDYYFVIKINNVLPAGEKTFEECKGRAINDYQNFLEENWVTELRKEFKVQVDQKVFEKIKKQIKI